MLNNSERPLFLQGPLLSVFIFHHRYSVFGNFIRSKGAIAVVKWSYWLRVSRLP